jgi:hypothetical protein
MSRCTCKTSKGEQCKNKAVEGSKYCSIHKKRCIGGALAPKAKAPKAKAKAKKIDMEELRDRVEAYALKNPKKGLQDLFDAMENVFGKDVGNLKREIAQFAVDILEGVEEQKAKAKKEKAKAKKEKAKAKKSKAKPRPKAKAKKAKTSESKEKLLKIVKKLKDMEAKSRGEEEIYFAGEYDPVQSDFEKRSNNLELGILTKGGSKVGFASLHVLRYIIDRSYPSQFMDDMEDAKDAKKTMLKFMKEEEERYGSHFPPGGLIRARLDDKMIEKTLDDIDVWTLDKLEKRIKKFK